MIMKDNHKNQIWRINSSNIRDTKGQNIQRWVFDKFIFVQNHIFSHRHLVIIVLNKKAVVFSLVFGFDKKVLKYVLNK